MIFSARAATREQRQPSGIGDCEDNLSSPSLKSGVAGLRRRADPAAEIY